MNHMTCEMCYRRDGKWFLLDESEELTLCGSCARKIRESGEMALERIEV